METAESSLFSLDLFEQQALGDKASFDGLQRISNTKPNLSLRISKLGVPFHCEYVRKELEVPSI